MFFYKQKTAYEMRISDWSSDVCSSDLQHPLTKTDRCREHRLAGRGVRPPERRYRQASGKRRFRLQLARGGQPVDDFAGPLQPTVELALRTQRLVQPQLALRLQSERSPKRRQAMEAPRPEERRVGQEGVRQGR